MIVVLPLTSLVVAVFTLRPRVLTAKATNMKTTRKSLRTVTRAMTVIQNLPHHVSYDRPTSVCHASLFRWYSVPVTQQYETLTRLQQRHSVVSQEEKYQQLYIQKLCRFFSRILPAAVFCGVVGTTVVKVMDSWIQVWLG